MCDEIIWPGFKFKHYTPYLCQYSRFDTDTIAYAKASRSYSGFYQSAPYIHAIRSHCAVSYNQGTGLSHDPGAYVHPHRIQLINHLARSTDGVTMLPTFMPVATQAAIKGLTPEQVESLGVTLILNNTYHLNLRPGLKVLTEAGGAHKFQGWERNLLTVRHKFPR